MRSITNNVQNRTNSSAQSRFTTNTNLPNRPGAPYRGIVQPPPHLPQQNRLPNASSGTNNINDLSTDVPKTAPQQRTPPTLPPKNSPTNNTSAQNRAPISTIPLSSVRYNNQPPKPPPSVNNRPNNNSTFPKPNAPPKQINTYFVHSGVLNPPIVSQIKQHPVTIKKEETKSDNNVMDMDTFEPNSPAPTTPQSSTTPNPASSEHNSPAPSRQNLPFMNFNRNGFSGSGDLYDKLKTELELYKQNANKFEEMMFIERGKAFKSEERADKYESEIVKLKNEIAQLKSQLRNRNDDQEMRRLRGDVEKLIIRLRAAEKEQEDSNKKISMLRRANEEMQSKLQEQERKQQQQQQQQQQQHGLAPNTPVRSYAIDREAMMAGLNDFEIPPLSPDFDKRIEENSLDFDSLNSDTDRESLIYDDITLSVPHISVSQRSNSGQDIVPQPSNNVQPVQPVVDNVSKSTVRTVTLTGSANKTINLVSKLLEDGSTHEAFFTLISQTAEPKNKHQQLDTPVKEAVNMIIIDDDDTVGDEHTIDTIPTSTTLDTKSWILYDHLNKMLNNRASVIGLLPILQKFLVSECNTVDQYLAKRRSLMQHHRQHNIQPIDIINMTEKEIDACLDNSYRVICSVFDVLSLLLLESSEVMQFVKYAHRKQNNEYVDEDIVQAWRDQGYYIHPSFANTHILSKQRPDSDVNVVIPQTNNDSYNMLLNADFMLDDYEGDLRVNVRTTTTTTSSSSITIPYTSLTNMNYNDSDIQKSGLVSTVIQILSDIPQLYSNQNIMLRILNFLKTIAWACYTDSTTQQIKQKMHRTRLQENDIQQDILYQFEPLISRDIFKQLLFGNEPSTTIHVKSAVLDTIAPMLQSPKIMTSCRAMGKGTQAGKPSLLDRISVFLNTPITNADDVCDVISFRHRIVNLYSYVVFSFDDGAKMLLHDDTDRDIDNIAVTQEVKNILPNQLILLLRKELDELQSGDSKHLNDERISLIQDLIRLLTVLGRQRKLTTSFRHDLFTIYSNLNLRSRKDTTFENIGDKSTQFTFDVEILKRI